MIRRAVPRLLVLLALIATVLGALPWLRAFPSDVGAAPLIGAAVLSVLLPVVTYRLGARLWLGVLIDVVALIVFLLLVVLHDPSGFGRIVTGLHHGPSQILTFALPLVSPRSLMVAPAVLIWTAGAVSGECLSRRWGGLVPYVGLLVSFGLAYAATQRAQSADTTSAQARDTLLAGALLLTVLLLRTAQSWVRQDGAAESTQPDGELPLRGLALGAASALVVALVAAVAVQSGIFPKKAATPQRKPLVNSSRPLAPLQFIAGLRPRTSGPGARVFTVHLDSAAPGYFGIANVDFYDGAGWSFDRTFRPSGGVLPPDQDSALSGSLRTVTQHYVVPRGPLTGSPWIPTLYRAAKVTGATVDIDPGSGMIVPSGPLAAGLAFTVQSQVAGATYAGLSAKSATADTSTPAGDVQLPPTLRTTLDKLISAFAAETQTPSTPALPFLKALQTDLMQHYALSPAALGSASGSLTPSAARHSGDAASHRPLAASSAHRSSPSPHRAKASPSKRPAATSASRTPSASPSSVGPSGSGRDLAGGTAFAEIVASILGQQHNGTPEQFATLIALVARELGIPARVVTGFRAEHHGAAMLPAGNYTVTTADAWTWAEVPIVGKGWVVLDASPSKYSDRSRDQSTGASEAPTPTASPSQAILTQASDGGHAVAPKVRPPHQAGAGPAGGLLTALLLVGAVLVLVLLIVFATRKQVRRARRRRVPEPRARLLGAWHETLDMLSESGLPDLTTLTSTEVADLAGDQFGSAPREQAQRIGAAADSATFSERTPVDAHTVDDAWTTSRELRRSVRRQLPWSGRLLAAVRYHHRGRVRVSSGPSSWADETASRAEAELGRGDRRGPPRRYQGRRRR